MDEVQPTLAEDIQAVLAWAGRSISFGAYPERIAERRARLDRIRPVLEAFSGLLAACKAAVSAYDSHQLYDKFPRPLLEAAISKVEGSTS